ncbi:MAG: tRNA (adenosine(37)-N6)-dimethylallyltransferase MiaA [Bacteroidales bacterium]
MDTIAISELRANLMKVLKEVRTGAIINITSRGKVIAKLVPPHDITDNAREKLNEISKTAIINGYFKNHQVAVMTGGSGMYIDAVCKGISELPDPDEKLRKQLKDTLENYGIKPLKEQLRKLDPEYYEVVDLKNPNRIMRALEVCMTTGQTFTSLRDNPTKERDFKILKMGLRRPRKELFDRIENRVDEMIKLGLIEEVKGLLEFRNLNSLNTVGYKEIFKYLDNECSLNLAIEKMKTNTCRYAKRQITWFNRDHDIHWFHPEEIENILRLIGRKGWKC